MTLSLDHRVALVLLSVLLLSAAAPLALGWARVIPPDDPAERTGVRRADRSAILLLFLVTLSYAAKLPSVSADVVQSWVVARFPASWALFVILIGQAVLILFPGLAAFYAFLRPGPLSQPLLWAGVLVALLWLAAPFLITFWLAS